MEAPSFASRRPAATALPAFSLPPPDIPRVTADGLSPLSSSGVNSGSSQSSQPSSTPGMYYSHGPGTWAPQSASSSSYGFASNGANHSSGSSLVQQPSYPSTRPMYPSVSPSMQHHFNNHSGRPASSPNTVDSLPTPSYQESPSLLNPISGAGGPSQSSQAPQQSPASQNPPASGPPPTETSYRPTHQYYPPSSVAQQQQQPPYSPFAHHQGQQHSPNVSSAPPSSAAPRTASISGQQGPLSGMAPPLNYGHDHRSHPSHYPGYHLPGNAVLSNMHHPGTPLAMVGGPGSMGMPPGYGHHGHHSLGMYGHGQSAPQQDRPFKCDQCPQSFNRNHDLKRHKRIHLAVKPFPCTFCEKSFSRKDALKRHRLVKGCGEKQSLSDGASSGTGPNDGSPPDKSEAMSDDTDGSPTMPKKETGQQQQQL